MAEKLLPVSPKVIFQVCALHKAFAADMAPMRPLSCVASQVLFEVSAMGEASLTVRATKRLLARVNPHVNLQISFAAALLPTNMAAVFHPAVARHVFGQRRRAVVVFTAHLTAFGAFVRFKVHAETRSGVQHLPTHSAEDVCILRTQGALICLWVREMCGGSAVVSSILNQRL